MKRSYIVLSLIVSQALCATDVTADFSGTNGTSSMDGKLKPAEVKVNSSNDAKYNTDWSGGTNKLDVMTDDLTFKFSDSSATNLILNSGFTFTNKIAQTNGSTPQANITLTKKNGNLTTLTIGSSSSSSVTLGSNINLKVTEFTDVKIATNLSIASNSTFDVSTIGNVTNDEGIVLGGDSSKLMVKNTLTNNGVIMMKGGSSIESSTGNNLEVIAGNGKRGSIIAQGGEATIQTANTDLTIKNQDITLRSIASKDSEGKASVAGATLVLKNTNGGSGTLVLGEADKSVTITGDISSDPSKVPSSQFPQGSEIGNLKLSGFDTINATNVSFKNINVISTDTTSMTLTSGVLGLENTTMSLGSSLAIGATSASTITLTGQNTISTTGALTITGTHSFGGGGVLDFMGQTISLGDTTPLSASFDASAGEGGATLGFNAKTINVTNLSLTNLTLQAINSTLTNTSMTLSDSILEAIDSEGNLADLTIKKNSTAGTINITNGKSATLKGEGITLTGQNINLQNTLSDTKTTLTLQAGSNGITINGSDTNGSTISGKNAITNNILNLNTPLLTLQGKVTLDKLTINTNQDLTIVGTESDTAKGLFFTNDTTISAGNSVANGTQYYGLTFTSDFTENQTATDESQAYVSFGSATTLKASNFTFQNQNIQLATGGSGVDLSLFAYGTGVVNGTYTDSGVFTFTNTTFTDGTSSTIQLFAGSGGVSVAPTNLTLKNVSLTSCLINGTTCTTTTNNTLNLSTTEGSINILGTSTISATKFVYGESEQGIGVDMSVGDKDTAGQLTITSTDTSDNFIFGGNLTIDNTASGTTLNINSNNNIAKAEAVGNPTSTLTQGTLSLEFRGGGLTAIGTSTNTMTVIAKDFKFTNLTDTDGNVTGSPFVKVKNTELTLNMSDSNGTSNSIELTGTTYLIGDTTAGTNEAKLKATKGTSNNQANQITLKLHDINAEGKASITENKLEFSDSNIFVGVLRDKNGNPTATTGDLTLKDANTTSTDPLTGTIASITLDSGKLQFQDNNSQSASITLNADSTLTSSGTSSLTLKTIKVGDDSSGNDGLYSLNVTDGTFTLTESTAGTQLGAITLGTQQGSIGGNFEYKGNSGSSYNALTLKGDLTSYGDSSISADTFTISAKDSSNKENYTISSTGGELKLIAKDTSNSLTATANIALSNGSLGYYGSDGTLASLTLDSSSSLSAYGDSTLQAKDLNLKGASVSASEGTLTLKGVSSSTTAGNVYVGNGGVLTLQNSNSTLASLKISSGSNLTLSADVGYVTPSSPLGNGKFGEVDVKSLRFESESGGLVQISLNSSTSSSSYSDSLFALREGSVKLISTQDGIEKKSGNASYTAITLDDIVTDTSGLTSITLTPYLQSGTNTQGQTIDAKNLLLDLRVSQTNVTQLIESIKDSSAKETMTSIVNSGNNALILESILQSSDNAFKVGMAEYISSGNTAVVQTSLEYINGAISSLSDSMLASNKIFELIAMLKNANVESRMVRGKNPFLAKTQLSSFIKSFIGTAYASSDEDSLLLEEDTTPKYGELWATFDGAMSFSKEESGNSSLYGFSAGYDTLLGEMKNYLLGFYASYGYGAYSVNYARNNSHNFGLGLYTRMSFENSEVDLILSQNVGLNHTEVDLGASNSYVAQALKQTLGYNFYTTDIEARYGYVFKVGSEDSPYYFRPFGGINFALIVNSGARGDGEAELGIQSMITYQLSVNVGVEMRKYFGEENYLYVLPILQKGLLHDSGGANVGFYGAENIPLTPSYDVDTSMALYVGGQGNVGDNLAVSGGVGVKIGFEKKDLLTNWNVGLRYKF